MYIALITWSVCSNLRSLLTIVLPRNNAWQLKRSMTHSRLAFLVIPSLLARCVPLVHRVPSCNVPETKCDTANSCSMCLVPCAPSPCTPYVGIRMGVFLTHRITYLNERILHMCHTLTKYHSTSASMHPIGVCHHERGTVTGS